MNLSQLSQASPEFRLLIRQLLNKDHHTRLGSLDGAQDLINHSFFSSVNWDEVRAREVKPPFKPNLKSPIDTKMFDKFSKRQQPVDSFVNSSLTRCQKVNFTDFEYNRD